MYVVTDYLLVKMLDAAVLNYNLSLSSSLLNEFVLGRHFQTLQLMPVGYTHNMLRRLIVAFLLSLQNQFLIF